MFVGLSVTNSNSVVPTTSSNGKLTSLFDAMSVQPPTTPNQLLNTDADGDGLLGLGNSTKI